METKEKEEVPYYQSATGPLPASLAEESVFVEEEEEEEVLLKEAL